MANKTIFQKLTDIVIGTGAGQMPGTAKTIANYNFTPSNDVLYKFDNAAERDLKLQQLKQQKLLSYQWAKSGYDTAIEQMAGANQVRVMYRDADMMNAWPEIGAALDIYAEECCTVNSKGKILNIYSKSERVKSVLEDLFVNRLDIHITLPLIVRDTCQYGNEFMFLNIEEENGIRGWRKMPVYEMRRAENGMDNSYAPTVPYTVANGNMKPDEVKFVWEGHNESIPYKNWQMAHFRLIKDSLFLPYGVSILNKARRAWRMLSMMEDAMLLYRLERSIERRMFKVNVGNMDDADIEPFLQDFANNIKRAPIIDPKTGQMDLRKNFLDVSADYFIPVRNGQDPSTIETVSALQNQTSMDDINYMENKVLAALRIPKTFLNFQEPQGKGQNLSILDIRFNRTVNSIQQAILMELNKIAIIHLYLLGFEDELTNFTLTMNNPSNQIEMMELQNMQQRVAIATSALAEQGGGIPLLSWHATQKEIMGKTDSEISKMLNEIRLENAIAAELQQTAQIIHKTGIFDKVDRIYGEIGAKYQAGGGQQGPGGPGGGGGMPPMGGGFGDALGDLGAPGGDDAGALGGDAGSQDLSAMGGGAPPAPEGGEAPMPTENIHKPNGRKLITEKAFNEYMSSLNEEIQPERVDIVDKALFINEELDSMIKELDKKLDNEEE